MGLDDGRPVRTYHTGDYFGELALSSMNFGVRSATITACEDCVLLTLSRASYLRVLASGEAMAKIMRSKATRDNAERRLENARKRGSV